MKTNCSCDAKAGLTLIELLVVIVCAVIVVAMLPPRGGSKNKARAALCLSHVHDIGSRFLTYADNHQGKFAIQTSITNGGTMEFLERNETFPQYQKLSEYRLLTSTLICPTDRDRRVEAENFESLTDTNLSYFLNADISTNNASKSIMLGDRGLKANGKPVGHGTFAVKASTDLIWTPEMHRNFGTLGFVDGHAELCRAANLNSVFRDQGLATVRLSVP